MAEHLQHTPGPWSARPIRGDMDVSWSIGIAKTDVADVYSDTVHGDANARLIAAAPDLLRVAELLVDWLNEEPGAHKLCDTARAAIAKATGASQVAA